MMLIGLLLRHPTLPCAPRGRRRDATIMLTGRLVTSVAVTGILTTAIVSAQAPAIPKATNTNPIDQKDQGKAAKVLSGTDRMQRGDTFQKSVAKNSVIQPSDNVAARKLILDRQKENLIARYTSLGRPLLRAELIFVRHVCSLDQEQFRRLSRDAELVLKHVVSGIANDWINQRKIALGSDLDGGKRLQDGLTALMKKTLSEPQWSRYAAELEKRHAGRKPIAIRYLVAAIDRELYLSEDQRATLAELLSAHWNEGWDIYLDYMLQGNALYPADVDSVVRPILNEVQRKLWQGSQRVRIAPVFGVQLGQFAQDPDALLEEGAELNKGEPGQDQMHRQLAAELERRALEIQLQAEMMARIPLQKGEPKKFEIRKAGPKQIRTP
jgi:hypothetical protein